MVDFTPMSNTKPEVHCRCGAKAPLRAVEMQIVDGKTEIPTGDVSTMPDGSRWRVAKWALPLDWITDSENPSLGVCWKCSRKAAARESVLKLRAQRLADEERARSRAAAAATTTPPTAALEPTPATHRQAHLTPAVAAAVAPVAVPTSMIVMPVDKTVSKLPLQGTQQTVSPIPQTPKKEAFLLSNTGFALKASSSKSVVIAAPPPPAPEPELVEPQTTRSGKSLPFRLSGGGKSMFVSTPPKDTTAESKPSQPKRQHGGTLVLKRRGVPTQPAFDEFRPAKPSNVSPIPQLDTKSSVSYSMAPASQGNRVTGLIQPATQSKTAPATLLLGPTPKQTVQPLPISTLPSSLPASRNA